MLNEIKLSTERIAFYKGQMVDKGTPVRFLNKGQAMCLTTGELASKGSNVIYHIHYWNFTKQTSTAIAEELGVKAVFSE